MGPSGEGPRRLAHTDEFDAAGQTLKSVAYEAGRPYWTHTYRYDARHRLVGGYEVSTEHGSYYESRTRCEYDSSGHGSTEMMKSVYRSKPKRPAGSTEDVSSATRHVVYDASGKPSSMTLTGQISGSGKPRPLGGKVTYKRDAKGRLAEETSVIGGSTNRTEYSYDANGRTVEVRSYWANDEHSRPDRLGRTDHVEYDDHGDWTLYRTILTDGTTTKSYSGYRFDRHGNWVRRIVDERYDPPNSMVARYAKRPAGTYAETREITYYPGK